MALLPREAVSAELKSLKGWSLSGKEIRKEFTRENFIDAMGFVVSVGLLAEKANHHPDIDIRWNKVTLVLSTHSAGGITEKDIALAHEIEKL